MTPVRYCDAGTCLEPANYIGSFTIDRGEAQTKAACCLGHVRSLGQELYNQGFSPKWSNYPHGPAFAATKEAPKIVPQPLELEDLP